MFDAVVTLVTWDEDIVATKVYRLEFDSEASFMAWMRQGTPIATNTEQLRGVHGQ